MKILHLLFALAFTLFFSCGESKNNDYADFEYESENYFEDENQERNTTNNQNIKGYKIMSKQFGMVFGVMPIPQSWKEVGKNKENIIFESPNGVKIYAEQFNSFFYSNNPQQNQFTQQNGGNVKPPKNIERLIQEDFKPYLQSKGVQYIGQFPLPQLANFDKNFDSALFKSTPENKQYQCVVTEWQDGKGNKSMGVIRYFTNQYTALGGMDWGYTINAMEAPINVYEQAKKDYINALLNFQINPQWVQANNQYYSQLSQQSNAGHQQRMAAINAQGQAIRNAGSTYSSMIDDSHESWKRRNAVQDVGHSNYINSGIWERSTVSDPNTGQNYQVEGQNKYYYGNNNNEYIGTDNSLYNPNLDNNVNNQEWTQYEIQN